MRWTVLQVVTFALAYLIIAAVILSLIVNAALG